MGSLTGSIYWDNHTSIVGHFHVGKLSVVHGSVRLCLLDESSGLKCFHIASSTEVRINNYKRESAQ